MSKYIPTIPIKDLTEILFIPIKLKTEQFSKQELKRKLKRACKNGNINKNKHVITFVTNNGYMKVNSTIWMVGKEYVLLKENLYIPIDSILDVT